VDILSALVPKSRNLTITEAAIHEYIGILATKAGAG
jgi:hypothetical protein